MKILIKKNVNLWKLKPIISFILILTYISPYYFFEIINKNISVKDNENITILEDIINFEKQFYQNLSTEIYDEFRVINLKNKLIEEDIKFVKYINPIITVIMTVYNQAHCLHACLRSIQNQSLKNIEIIIIDDCSLDNSSEIIREYQKEDPRIILIEHDSNEGTIKTRADGIKKAKGKYITFIDGDDAFIHKDILNNSLYIIERANLDIVEFQLGEYKNGKLNRILKNYPQLNLTYIIHQPELKTKFILTNKNFPEDFLNRAIFGKLINKELCNKMLLDIGPEYTDDYIIYAEDTLMVVSLLHLANSYYLMKEIGYYYCFDPERKVVPKLKNKVCKTNNKIKDFSFFKFLKFLVGRIEYDEKEQIMAFKEIATFNEYKYYLNRYKMGKEHYDIIFYILNKTLEFEFLKECQKDEIIKLKNRFIAKRNREKIVIQNL